MLPLAKIEEEARIMIPKRNQRNGKEIGPSSGTTIAETGGVKARTKNPMPRTTIVRTESHFRS